MEAQMISQTLVADKIAMAALIVSILSLIISIVGIVIQKKLNRVNLEAKHFEEIFRPYILEKIPNKVAVLKFDSEQKLDKNYTELNDTLMEMVRKARYFSYVDKKFYKKLSNKTMVVEDLLVSISGKKIAQVIEQNKKLIEIEKAVSKVIICINKNYSR